MRSGRPGYDELARRRGHDVADEIVPNAELYSDAAHQPWDIALRWAIDAHDRPADAEGWWLPSGAGVRDQLDWAAARARELDNASADDGSDGPLAVTSG